MRFALWWLSTRNRLAVDPFAEYGSAEFKQALTKLTTPISEQGAGHLSQVTFHPSYGYEDFIEGYRPISDGHGLELKPFDGVFKRVCTQASKDPGGSYLILIDEINRGNVAKIFGELITLLEKDKRGLSVMLPQTGDRFTVPPNIAVLGTMNTADRSIRLLDSALRRRFAFVELMPDATVLEGNHIGGLHLADLLGGLNQRILARVGRERQVGHSYFLQDGAPIDSPALLQAAVRHEVLPLLQEYAYDDYAMLAEFLGSRIVDIETHSIRDLDDDELVAALYAEFNVQGTGE